MSLEMGVTYYYLQNEKLGFTEKLRGKKNGLSYNLLSGILLGEVSGEETTEHEVQLCHAYFTSILLVMNLVWQWWCKDSTGSKNAQLTQQTFGLHQQWAIK